MSGTLYVVATPIGNLEDITLRAIRVLREADVIAAEDTRRTSKLLAHHGIHTRMLSFHEHNTRSRIPQLIERLRRGAQVAVVSDAGTPGISDPGTDLVAACHAHQIRVEAVPGASATLAAAVASGFPLARLTILGFPPARLKDRTHFFKTISKDPGTVVFFEAPHRIQSALRDLGKLLVDRPIMVAREITKLHEELLLGTAEVVVGQITDPRGEYTVVVAPQPDRGVPLSRPTDEEIVAEVGRMTEFGLGKRRAAMAAVAKRHGMTTGDVYSILVNKRGSGERP
jgi:16S rRNA (cytidine1402-2'-O)-methyltransferase